MTEAEFRLLKLAEVRARSSHTHNPDTARIETDWITWYSAIFGQQFVDALAPHHVEAIEWHWLSRTELNSGLTPSYLAYFPIWPRGHMKSTIARRMAICDAARSVDGYCLYASGTKKKVKGHAVSIEALLASDTVRRYYPLLSQVRRNERGASKGWTADFIYTEHGYVFHFVGLEEGVAGANVEGVRPTFQIPDDVDDREDSPVISANRFQVFTRSYLPTRQKNTLVFFPQNLIAEHTVMNQIYSGAERVLTNRKPTHPIPAAHDLVTETREEDGIVKDVVVSCKPTWKFYDRERIQEEIDTIGLAAFEAECQHNLDLQKAGLIMHMIDWDVHLITFEMFREKFGCDPFPSHWEQRHLHDVGYTGEKAHPGVFNFMGIAAANSKMPGRLFLVPEVFLGEDNSSPDWAAERYLERILRYPGLEAVRNERWTDEQRLLARGLYRKFVEDHPLFVARMSHENKATRRVFEERYGMQWEGVNPGADGGIEQLQHYHQVDYRKPHPFKKGVMGVSNIYWIVRKDQLEQAKDEWGMARGRLEAKRWRWKKEKLTETGLTVMKPMKAFDDWWNSLMMGTFDMAFTIAPLTKREEVEARLNDRLQMRSVESGEVQRTPGWEKARQIERGRIEKEIEQEDSTPFQDWWKDTIILILSCGVLHLMQSLAAFVS